MGKQDPVSRQGLSWATAVLSLGLAVSWYLTASLQQTNQREAAQRLEQQGQQILRRVGDRLKLLEYGLRGLRGTMLAVDDGFTTIEGFRRYNLSREMDIEFPGAHGFGLIRRISAADEAKYVAQVRASGQPDFSVRQLAPHAGERFVIQFVSPEETNRAAFGLDIASESNRKQAAELAMRSGLPQLSGPITLVQAVGAPSQAFLFLLPIYEDGLTPNTEAERIAKCIGWSYAALVLTELLDALAIDTRQVALLLHDRKYPQAIYLSDQTTEQKASDLSSNHETIIYGREWLLTLIPRPAFTASLRLQSVSTLAAFCVLISLLGALILYLAFVIKLRSRQGQLQQRELAALVTNSPAAIIGLDPSGIINSWNARAETLFGYSFSDVAGRISDFLVPEAKRSEELAHLEKLTNGEVISSFESLRCHKDGSVIDVSVAIAPIYNNRGRMMGVSQVIRDIRQEKQDKAYIASLNSQLESQVVNRTTQLEDTQRRLQTVLDAVPSLVSYWDRELTNLVVNQAYVEASGKTKQEIFGQYLSTVDASKLHQSHYAQIKQALNGSAQRFERTIVDAHGRKRFMLTDFVPDLTDTKVAGVFIIESDITDITEHRMQLAEALQENQVLLSTIDVQLQLSITDKHGKIIGVNDNFCRSSGFQKSELIGEDHKLLNSGVHSANFIAGIWREIEKGETWRGELCNRLKSGELRWYDVAISPFMDGEGKIGRYVSLRSDITERKLADLELLRLNTLFTRVLDADTNLAIVATNAQGEIQLYNTGAEKMFGYSAKEIQGKMFPERLFDHKEINNAKNSIGIEARNLTAFQTILRHTKTNQLDNRKWNIKSKQGRRFLATISLSKIEDADGVVAGYLAIATDISAQHDYERALLSARDQLRIAADVANLGVWSWDLRTDELIWNDRMMEIYEVPFSQRQAGGLKYEHWRNRVHAEDVEATEAKLLGAVNNTDIYDPIFRIVNSQGEIRYIEASAHIERDENGKAQSVTGINLDITEQQQIEIHLRNAKKQAEATSAAKSAFMANMSHEIRTPMNAVMGMLQLIQQTQLNNRQLDYVTKASRAAKSLLGILNDILDFSKLDANKMQLDSYPFEVEGLLRDLASVLSGTNTDRDVEIIFDVDAKLPSVVIGDRQRLQQILINLASNALKFTERGQVIVGFKLIGSSNGSAHLKLYVQDTGIGISAEQQSRLFSSFEQAEASTNRRFGGTGLGLVISKELVALMGAELKFESKLDEGTCFWFELELPIEKAQPLVDLVRPELTDLRILIVEDNLLMSEVLSTTLLTLGWQVDQAYDGLEAVQKVKDNTELGIIFDVILMDWRMPRMDGLDAAVAINKMFKNQSPVIVMVTAYGREKLIEDSKSSLISDFLLKPVTPLQVLDSVGRALGFESNEFEFQSSSEQPLAGLRLLLVEDNPLNQQVAKEMLESVGANITLAGGGLEGVANVIDAKIVFDLVLMDVQMPDIDGLEATRRIRADSRFMQLPILAMTANASDEDRKKCLKAGMTDHIGKPIDLAVLTARIANLVHGKAPQRQPQQNDTENLNHDPIEQPSGPLAKRLSLIERPTHSANLAPEDLSEHAELIDPIESTLSRFGDKLDLLHRMLEKLQPELTTLMEDLERAIPNNDHDIVLTIVHTLKGVAATMGARLLSNHFSALEKQLRKTRQPLVSVIDAARVIFLWELLHRSVNELTAAVIALQEAKDEEPLTSTLKRRNDNWHAQLHSLAKQLCENNLQALDDVNLLLDQPPEHLQEPLKQLSELVESLDFEEALILARQLLEES